MFEQGTPCHLHLQQMKIVCHLAGNIGNWIPFPRALEWGMENGTEYAHIKLHRCDIAWICALKANML